MKRSEFIRVSSLAALAPLGGSVFGAPRPADRDEAFFKKILAINDAIVGDILATIQAANLKFGRKIAYDISSLAAAWACPESRYYHDSALVEKLQILVDFLRSSQAPDGTVNVGNLESPPDTAFVVEIVSPGAHILSKETAPELATVNAGLKQVLVQAGNALLTGGVHTPNHRWVVCAAMAQINAIYPNSRYGQRINEWLGEGVFIDADGHYPERSGTYSSVEDNAFITIARLMNKPALFGPVRKNLEMYRYYIEENGELVSNDSRRQDQYAPRMAGIFYLSYRYMAIRDKNPDFAAVAQQIETTRLFKEEVLDRALPMVMENALLQQQLPEAAPMPDEYVRFFPTSSLLRVKRRDMACTLFGGVDQPLIIASGRSCSPDFFSFRRGKAILKYLRLSSGFFSTGYFYSEGMRRDGLKYILHKKLQVPYYQPLPANKRKPSGDYKLSPSIDDRFWNKMDFSNRPVSNVKILDTRVVFSEITGGVQLEIDINGMQQVPVTIELCFPEEGKLSGSLKQVGSDYFLQSGFGELEIGGDRIQFGEGGMEHQTIVNLEGERYSTHFGSLRTSGKRVFITGYSPFKKILIFR